MSLPSYQKLTGSFAVTSYFRPICIIKLCVCLAVCVLLTTIKYSTRELLVDYNYLTYSLVTPFHCNHQSRACQLTRINFVIMPKMLTHSDQRTEHTDLSSRITCNEQKQQKLLEKCKGQRPHNMVVQDVSTIFQLPESKSRLTAITGKVWAYNRYLQLSSPSAFL